MPGIRLLDSVPPPGPDPALLQLKKQQQESPLSPPLPGPARNRKSWQVMDVGKGKGVKVWMWEASEESHEIFWRTAPCARSRFSWSYPSPRHISGVSRGRGPWDLKYLENKRNPDGGTLCSYVGASLHAVMVYLFFMPRDQTTGKTSRKILREVKASQ